MKRRPTLASPRVLLPLAALFCLGTGCTRKHVVARSETGAPRYDRVDVQYELTGGAGALASRTMQPVRLAAATGDLPGARPEPTWKSAVLRIRHPHPDAREGHARATLRLSTVDRPLDSGDVPIVDRLAEGVRSVAGGPATGEKVPVPERAGPAGGADDEIWILDVPREQVDLLLVDLARSGFFDAQSRPSGPARIAVRIDRGRTLKTWDSDDRLDDFVTRVYTRGWIGGFAAATAEPTDDNRGWLPF